MNLKDTHGNTLSGATASGLERLEEAQQLFRCYSGDPLAATDDAIAAAPGMVMAHVLRAWLNLLGTEPGTLPAAREALAIAQSLPATRREAGHVAAVAQLVAGRWHAAARILEDVSIDHPADALALQVGHQLDFFTGNSRMLRDRIARALPSWSESMPGYHALLGMHAFGLEETAEYGRAEAEGRRAVELEPRDGWAQHAVAHVMEMQGRQRDGVAWMRANPDAWAKDSFFAVHNWWHLALFHLELGEVDAVLELYDGPIYGQRSTVILDMVDASALLWRLHLRGVDVGDRWKPVAEAWRPHARAGNYAFNDAHAVMAFIGAGLDEEVAGVQAAQQEAVQRNDDNAAFTREVGQPVVAALKAFADGDYGFSVDALRSVRGIAQRFGGSHAQRDLLDLTLIESAWRSGNLNLARALTAERLQLKSTSPWAVALHQRSTAQRRPEPSARRSPAARAAAAH